MKRKQFILLSSITAALLCMLIIACNKKFDEPPTYVAPNVKATTTIAAIKAKHAFGTVDSFSVDDVIEGVVIANDSSGNFYKEIVIQDSSGGIDIKIDNYDLYTSYPVGRKVFVKLKGLFLSDDHNLMQLGATPDASRQVTGIPTVRLEQLVIKGNINQPVVPVVVNSVKDLNTNYQYRLIQLDNYEFQDADTAGTFADAVSNGSVNYTLKNCADENVILRTSGFASFAGLSVPNGNGTLYAIYTVYGSTRQLYVRDTSDVKFYNARCGKPFISIADLRNQYSGSGVSIGSYLLTGTVISDAAANNISGGNIVLQQGKRGIDLYFGSSAATDIFKPGDSIIVDVTGGYLKPYNGSLELSLDATALPTSAVASGKTVDTTRITIKDFNENLDNIEWTLVKFENSVAGGGSVFSGDKTLTDITGNTTLHTSNYASFAQTSLPAENKNWIGYGSYNNTATQFQIRDITDITAATNSGPGGSDSNIVLTTSPYVLNFDALALGLPTGVFVKTGANNSVLGADGTFTAATSSWSSSSSGFKNYASATGLTGSEEASVQGAYTNRALGVRQTSSGGYDPGAAFVFEIDNTTGKSNLSMNFLLQSLDNSIGRTTVWQVDYGIGDNPSSFMQVATSPSVLSTGPTFGSTNVAVSFGSALNNLSSKIWIRIITKELTTGSGSRPSSGIDDVSISWQ